MAATRRGAAWLAVVILVSVVSCTSDPEAAKRAYLAKGNESLQAGKPREAIVQYRNALKHDPRFGEARFQLGEAQLAAGNNQAAYTEFMRAADLMRDDRRVQQRAGEMLLLAGRFEDAKSLAERLLKKNIRDADAQLLLGYSLAGLKDIPGAIAEIEKGIGEASNRFSAYANLGLLQRASGDLVRAESAFKNAIAVAPQSPRAHLALAGFYWSTQRTNEAEQTLKRAHEVGSGDPSVNRALAMFYLSRGRFVEAEPYLKTVADKAGQLTAKLDLADYYVAMQRSPAAVAILEPLAKDAATRKLAAPRLAAISYANGSRAEAHSLVDTLLKEDRKNLGALMLKARFHLIEGKFDAAVGAGKEAVAADPKSPDAAYTLGLAHARLDDSAEATKAFSDALRLNPKLVDAEVELARLALTRGDSEAAVKFARTAAERHAQNREARLLLAGALLTRGDLPAAEREVASLARDFADWAPAHVQYGKVFMRRGQAEPARRAFDRALELDPRSIEALGGIVGIEIGTNRLAVAIARVENEVAKRPKDGELLSLAGDVYSLAGKDRDAERMWHRALEADASNLKAYDRLGQLYIRQNKLDEALRRFEAFTAQRPKSVAAHTMVGYILQAQRKNAAARERYEKVLQLDPNAAVAGNNLAWMYADEGTNLDVALQLAQMAKRRLPEQPEVSDTLAWVYYKKGLAHMAIAPLRACVEKDPKNPIYRYHLGLAYAKAGDVKRARQLLQQALKIQTDFDGAAEARRILASL